jgi:hypothetical protein
MNPRHMYVGDRIVWAQKWHGIIYDEKHHKIRSQVARDKAKAYYHENADDRKAYIQRYQMTNKIRAINYLGGQCQCGEQHPSALQFHHRDPSTKLFSITSKELSTPKKRPWDTIIIPELDKCDLLCANCHFKEHAVLSWDTIEELKREA